MAVRIVTDSSADLDPVVARALNIEVVPLLVRFGREEYRDGVDIGAEEFYGRLTTEKGLPATSQPPAEAFAEVYRRLAADEHDIISIHLSSKLSGTINAAAVGHEQIEAPGRFELIDSYAVSMGLGLIVEAAARAASAGQTFDEVARVAKAAVGGVHVYVALGTVEFLRRGGRIGRANSMVGSMLNIKPVLEVADGEVRPVERIRTWTKAVKRLERLALKDRDAMRLHVGTSGSPHLAAQFVERLRPEMPHTDFTTGYIGPTVGVYAGPGALGFCTLARR